MRITFLLLFVACLATSYGQWTKVFPSTGAYASIEDIEYDGTNMYAASLGSGVLKSTDGGNTWTLTSLSGLQVTSIAIAGSTVFAGTQGTGVYKSADQGATWTAINTKGIGSLNIRDLAVIGSSVYAGTSVGVSVYNGIAWSSYTVGFSDYTSVRKLLASGTDLFAGTNGLGIFGSYAGSPWSSTSSGLTNTIVTALGKGANNIYAGTFNAFAPSTIYRSVNNGSTWSFANGTIGDKTTNAFAYNAPDIFAGTTGGGIYKSGNSGGTWVTENTGLTSLTVQALAVMGPHLFAGTSDGKIWKRLLSQMTTNVDLATSEEFSIGIYPNPANGIFNISGVKEPDNHLTIYDLIGEKVFDTGLIPGLNRIDVSRLRAGLYNYIVSQSGGKHFSGKLVVE